MRVVSPTRRLPSGRAVLGGLLIAVAVLGVFAAYRGATGRSGRQFVVAGRDLVAGTRITAADLAVRTMALPPELAARAESTPDALVGDVTVAPLAEGDLIQASSVVDAPASEPSAELSFAVPRDRAVNGDLGAGERIDLVVTYGSGDTAWSEVAVRSATVVAIRDGEGPLGLDATAVLTIALPSTTDVLPVTHAIRAGEITVVRTTFAPGPATDSYHPMPPPR